MSSEHVMTQPIPSLFSKPQNDAPWWLLPILTFVVGVASTAATMMPGVLSDEGYQAGRADALRDADQRERLALYSGALAGYDACKRGDPIPFTQFAPK